MPLMAEMARSLTFLVTKPAGLSDMDLLRAPNQKAHRCALLKTGGINVVAHP
jgi:hypothetical protein